MRRAAALYPMYFNLMARRTLMPLGAPVFLGVHDA